MSRRNYWTTLRQRKISRRTMLGASAKAGVGAAGLALVGCGDDDDDAAPAAVDTSAIDAAAGDASAAASAAGEASAAASEAAAAASQAADAAADAAALAAEAAESEDAANAAAAAEAAAAAAAQAADAASAAGDAAAAAVADAAAQAAEAAAQAARDAAAAVEAGTATAEAAQAAIDAAAEAAAAAAAAAGEASAAAGAAAATAQETAEAAAETAAAAVAAAQEAAEAAGEAASAAAAAIAADLVGEDFSVPWPLDQVDLDATIVGVATTDGGGLDPHKSGSFGNFSNTGGVFSPPVVLDPRNNSVAAHLVAPEWIDPVTLRAAVAPAPFHDGSILTAHDLVFSYDRIFGRAAYHDGGATSDHPGGWTPANPWLSSGWARHEAVDDRTWAIEIDAPNAEFITAKMPFVGSAPVVSRADVERRGDTAVDQSSMGTGPYRFVSHTDDEDFVYERFDDHLFPIDYPVRVPHAPHHKQLTVLVRPELQSRLAGLEAGEIDLADSLGPDVVKPFLDDPDFTVQFGPNINYCMQNLFPNLYAQTMEDGSPNPFLDVRVRRAANHAINRQSLIDNLLLGVGEQSLLTCNTAQGYPTPEQKQEVTYAYDPERARALLAEAGYPDGFDTHLYWTPEWGGSYISDMVLAVAQDLTAVGIRAEPVSVPITDYFTDAYTRGRETAKPGLMWFFANTVPDVASMWDCCAGPDGFYTISPPLDPSLHELFLAQKVEQDPARRLEMITELLLEHARQAYYIFIVEPPDGVLTRGDVNWPKGGRIGTLWGGGTPFAAQKHI